MASLGGWFGDGGVGRFGDPDTPDTQPGLSPTEETELRIRISHQVASALQPDPRPGRGGDTCPGSTVDGSWSSLLSYVGVPFVSTGVRVGSSSFVTPHHVPPLQQGVLPEVELSDFDPYLRRSRIGSSAYRYKKGVDDTSDTSASETGDEPAGCSFVEDPGFSSPETAGASRRDDAPGDDSWRDVPSLFFQEQFSLQDPEVFHTVCGDAFVCDPMFANLNSGAQAALVSRRYELRLHQHEHISDADADKLCEERCAESALQSRLARHLDVVETLLIHKVERKQNHFIAAALLINDLVDAVEKAQVVSISHPPRSASLIAHTRTRRDVLPLTVQIDYGDCCPYIVQYTRYTRTRRDVLPLTVCPYIAICKTDISFYNLRCAPRRGRAREALVRFLRVARTQSRRNRRTGETCSAFTKLVWHFRT